jgi:hypothetical protein
VRYLLQFPKTLTDENFGEETYKRLQCFMRLSARAIWIFADEPMPLKSPEYIERMDKELLVNTYWYLTVY